MFTCKLKIKATIQQDIEIPSLHVKEHQDKHIPGQALEYEAKFNIQADQLATTA
jgi:hypothetical protein